MLAKRLIPITLLGVVSIIAFTGCSRNPTIVTINGEKITRADYFGRMEVHPVNGQVNGQPTGTIVLDQMTQEILAMQLAKEKGVPPTEEQVKKRFEFEKKQDGIPPGTNIELFKKRIRTNQALVNVAIKGVKVSEKEIREAYEKMKDSPIVSKPAQVNVGMILCNSEAKIKQANDQIKRGVDFATVSANLSDDERIRRNNGVIGWIKQGVPVSQEDKVFSDTVFRLKVNQVSEPIKSRTSTGKYQWVILKVLDKKPSYKLTYEEMREPIRELIAASKVKVSPQELLTQKMKSSKIIVTGETPVIKAFGKLIAEAKKEKTRKTGGVK